MFQTFKDMIHAGRRARWFWLQYVVYALLTIISTLWAYARLDYVRSYDAEQTRNIDKYENEQ